MTCALNTGAKHGGLHHDTTGESGRIGGFCYPTRTANVFSRMFLQKEIRRHALGEYVVLFGFPNPKALAIVRRVGYRCVGQKVRRARVLRSATYLANYLPGWSSRIVGAAIDGLRWFVLAIQGFGNYDFRSQWQEAPDATFNGLWQRAAAPDVVMGVRDMAFLKWRFLGVTAKTFKFFTVVTHINQSLAAYAVCTGNGPVLNVEDFLVDPGNPGAGARLWLDLSLEATRMGYISLSVELLGSDEQQRQLLAAGLVARSQRPVCASVAQSLDGTNPASMDTSVWYLTAADIDG